MTGDIIWAPFPFTNLTAAKTRPALVVADVIDGTEYDWILCEITTGRVRHDRAIAIARSCRTAAGQQPDPPRPYGHAERVGIRKLRRPPHRRQARRSPGIGARPVLGGYPRR